MASAVQRAAVVALVRLGRRSPTEYADLLEQQRDPEALLVEEVSQEQGQATLLPPNADELIAEAASDVARWSDQGFELITALDETYPQNLREVHDRPPLIFVAGRVEPDDARSVAVIGARSASDQGIAAARTLAGDLARAGYVVVSGLAAGIDAAAHLAALEAGGRTVGVIGTGLAHSYPPQNADLQRRIAAEGAVISQFWPETAPTRRTFPLRNAVMSGLARATLVVEASYRSGARVQARLALAHGRPVFLLRSLLGEPWARDVARRPAVYVVDDAREVIEKIERLRDAVGLGGEQ